MLPFDWPAGGLQVVHRDFHQRHDARPGHFGLARKLFLRRAKHVDVDVRHRPEAAALDQDRLFVQHFGGLQHFARGRKHRRAAQAQLHQPQAHHAVIDVPEGDARELDHVDFDAPRAQVVEQRLDELFGFVIETERAVEQVHADDAQGFLLQGVFGVEHPHVHDDLAVLVARMGLKPHAHPAVALVGALEVARRNGVGKRKEGGRVAAALAQSVQVQLRARGRASTSSRCRQTYRSHSP